MTDPLYGENVEEPDPDVSVGLSDAVIQEQLERIVAKKQQRAPRDRSLKHSRRDR